MSPRSAAFDSASSAERTSPSSRSERNRSSLATCWAYTSSLSTRSTSSLSSAAGRNVFTPISFCRPASMRAWVRAAASSMRIFGMPCSMALAMPPARSVSSMCAHARSARSCVSRST